MASAPVTMITTAITVAKMGRSMKKRESNVALPHVVGRNGVNRGSRLGRLGSFHDHPIAGIEPGRDQPFGADRLRRLQLAQLDDAVAADDQCGRLSLLIAS